MGETDPGRQNPSEQPQGEGEEEVLNPYAMPGDPYASPTPSEEAEEFFKRNGGLGDESF